MSDASTGQSASSGGPSIVDVVRDVVSADVATYGVGWPEKIPPPEIWIPDDGWTVEIPVDHRIDVVPVTTGFRPWIAIAVVAVFVLTGVLVFLHGTTPTETPVATAESSTAATATVPASCAQTPTVAPIAAVFNQPTFSTTYTSVVSNAGDCGLTLQWAGPNCGTWTPQQAQSASGSQATALMVWQHPHPPCDPTTDHADVTVTLTVAYAGGTLKCSYQGAASGNGPTCARR